MLSIRCGPHLRGPSFFPPITFPLRFLERHEIFQKGFCHRLLRRVRGPNPRSRCFRKPSFRAVFFPVLRPPPFTDPGVESSSRVQLPQLLALHPVSLTLFSSGFSSSQRSHPHFWRFDWVFFLIEMRSFCAFIFSWWRLPACFFSFNLSAT